METKVPGPQAAQCSGTPHRPGARSTWKPGRAAFTGPALVTCPMLAAPCAYRGHQVVSPAFGGLRRRRSLPRALRLLPAPGGAEVRPHPRGDGGAASAGGAVLRQQRPVRACDAVRRRCRADELAAAALEAAAQAPADTGFVRTCASPAKSMPEACVSSDQLP